MSVQSLKVLSGNYHTMIEEWGKEWNILLLNGTWRMYISYKPVCSDRKGFQSNYMKREQCLPSSWLLQPLVQPHPLSDWKSMYIFSLPEFCVLIFFNEKKSFPFFLSCKIILSSSFMNFCFYVILKFGI